MLRPGPTVSRPGTFPESGEEQRHPDCVSLPSACRPYPSLALSCPFLRLLSLTQRTGKKWDPMALESTRSGDRTLLWWTRVDESRKLLRLLVNPRPGAVNRCAKGPPVESTLSEALPWASPQGARPLPCNTEPGRKNTWGANRRRSLYMKSNSGDSGPSFPGTEKPFPADGDAV